MPAFDKAQPLTRRCPGPMVTGSGPGMSQIARMEPGSGAGGAGVAVIDSEAPGSGSDGAGCSSTPGRWSIQIALQVGDRLHHLGHRLDQLPMPAQALLVGERGAFLLPGQGRLPGRAVRLQRPGAASPRNSSASWRLAAAMPILLIGETRPNWKLMSASGRRDRSGPSSS